MATYKQIQAYVKQTYGYVPKTCWIAHMKELCGLQPAIASNRHSVTTRAYPCPPGKQEHLRKTFQHFQMIQNL